MLHSLYKIQNERTINSIYHLLTGKQSIQTIQDAHLFYLERFFALYKLLRMEQFNEQLLSLINQNYIKKIGENEYILTTEGIQFVKNNLLDDYYWNGMEFHQIDELFMRRLFLTIQVWTNRQAGISRYIPIVDDVKTTTWVKKFYKRQGSDVSGHLRQLYAELVHLFAKLPHIYPTLFMKQITTDQTIGLTDEQLANKFKQSLSNIYLMCKNYEHYILLQIKSRPENYPLLHHLMEDLNNVGRKTTITNSAKVTEGYVKRGFTPEQIAMQRGLKVTTIYDHIVEIALHDDQFPLERFVSYEIKREIFEAVTQLNSFKLKNIKALVSEDVSYFQIRLALTKINKLVVGDANG